ncbi:hydroxymethylbilane synthase [Methylophilaceae bacterium]|jgi:hydroxymethylbilane synthase|nr:hydroxymethylbilane synthase [Methylophilaceae bacterium]MDC1173138.1 hydroxymethylbilane synthase [Methylophilaceae bacterium]|tara:strand:- start:1525 stop:2439 length:915 start_codon:yes stop_codon:yes gene_type:complete
MITTLTIASRESPLAMWQADHIKKNIQALYPAIKINIEGFRTQGDILLDQSLAKIGGKGLFIKELEQALLNNKADLAVHSMKDLPMDIPKGFKLAVITERGDARDAFVSNQYDSLEALPPGSIIGTSSLRRQSQIQAKFPELKILPLRGNLQTRLKKLDEKNYDAIILAAAGLIRMGLKERIKLYIDPTLSIPAVGQGALGIEILESNTELLNLIAPLNNDITSRCVLAERTVSRSLAGSCTAPLGAYASIRKNKIYMHGFVATPDGSQIIFSETNGPSDSPEDVGKKLSQLLIAQGAKKILDL